MNKLCYRVIFNKTRGLLMAVSELGRSHGAAPGADGMATSAVPPLNAARLAELTGRRFLDGYSTDEAQYRALLEAGVTVARQYNLKVGVELSAAQIAALTADVVLLVEKDVVLPDGSTTRALVPQLYVRLKDGDINGHGALLAADSINLKISDSANNSGTIAGRNLLTLDAATINNNGGRLTAKDATVVAALDVNNIGGTIDGCQRRR